MGKALNELVEQMKERAAVAEMIAEGDLNVTVQVHSAKDSLGTSLERMVMSLNGTLGKVVATTDRVAGSSGQIKSASESLSQGAIDSASSLEEISASMTEIESQTQLSAKSASSANSYAQAASTAAEAGSTKMAKMRTAMEHIEQNSNQTQKIIKTIEDIAFQTNLLALNAAVEAARAGTHGKGFAVVADEVLSLAGRSAKAAKETADLIGRSGSEIAEGVAISEETAQALSEIAENVNSTSTLVSEIATAAAEQAEGITQISAGLSLVDGVVQQNSASAEESASASFEMATMADQLMTIVSGFSLSDTAVRNVREPKVEKPAPVTVVPRKPTKKASPKAATPTAGKAPETRKPAPATQSRTAQPKAPASPKVSEPSHPEAAWAEHDSNDFGKY